ncbi:TIGR03808 family TAT-translocated repetitive protein [Kumtagia ephedrae]|uniref:TIGR03808 family TAT-translocated repetitive protein n=1 Tax=Kumtagia ephedrae TaxID=2116701 RepID=A0A2P7RVU7_9HYPH|nr:TIGR03808 family TAT-translocated repetitive protein [Mesorhizobium ephedrae]PSJ54321.1 TIGR03808 family TAT-translocated repetitive protein [Mesorhizobium ephedrae]
MLNRRHFLAGSAGLAATAALSLPAAAVQRPPAGIETAHLRGAINAAESGIAPGALDDQSKAFAKLLRKAETSDAPIFLPPGTYVVSNITLPRRLRLTGVPGATRILYGGDGHLLLAEHGDHIELSGLVLDGANRWIGEYAHGLVDLRRISHLVVDDCQILGSGSNGLALEGVSGRIERTTISGAGESGIYSVEAGRLSIAGNSVTDCANGGILVHRWQAADDFTMVTNNRVERIAARRGGTGPYGNGINAFRADHVMIANNSIVDCAFSAIRANSSGDIQIANNTCVRSGETAIYAEFAFEGAVIGGNVVNGAANGISVVNYNEGGRMAIVSGNIVRNLVTAGPYPADPPGFGVGITVEADTTVTGNVVEEAPLYGIKIGWGPYMRNVSATSNVIRNSHTGIAVSVVEGCGPAVIADNVVEAAPAGAVVGFRWSEAVTGDMAETGSGYGHLTVERNHVS